MYGFREVSEGSFNSEITKPAVFCGLALLLRGMFPYPGREGVISRRYSFSAIYATNILLNLRNKCLD
ncbi:MAG TPA: hypothetical protein VFD91_02840 [Mariniphaga sp.]|nr:hypothetical protein [Mariniphaga sp.]